MLNNILYIYMSSTVQQVKDIFITTRQPLISLRSNGKQVFKMAAHANNVVKLIEALK